jgi:hypothetical protein
MEPNVLKKRKNTIRRLIEPNTINRLPEKCPRTKKYQGLCFKSSDENGSSLFKKIKQATPTLSEQV